MYNAEKRLKKNKDVLYPSFDTLFGKEIPTSRKNVVGKFMLKKCNENMKKLTKTNINLIDTSKALILSSLKSLLN